MHYALKGREQSLQAMHLYRFSAFKLDPKIGTYPSKGTGGGGMEWDGMRWIGRVVCHSAVLIKFCFVGLYDGEAQAAGP